MLLVKFYELLQNIVEIAASATLLWIKEVTINFAIHAILLETLSFFLLYFREITNQR